MTEITQDIEQVCADLLQRYKDKVEDTGHKASGTLNTATYRVSWDGKWFELSFNLEYYWKYLENGTKPHFPPIDAIENWITVKRIVPQSINNRVPTTRQLAYLICREISKNGTKPTKLLQKTIDESDDLIDKIVDLLTQQLEEEIDKEVTL